MHPPDLQGSRFRAKTICNGHHQPGFLLHNCPDSDRHMALLRDHVDLGDSNAYNMDHVEKGIDEEGKKS